MQHDEVIWQVVNNNFCSYKVRTKTSTFCKNQYNATGLCNRQSCPLANSNYATVREIEGTCFLFRKTIERAHSPRNLWEKIRLSKNYEQATATIEAELEYWAPFLAHKCKQRLAKIHAYLRKMRKLRLGKDTAPLLSVNKSKTRKREARREEKALSAAKLDDVIERELLDRLQKGVYGDIYNFPQTTFENVLKAHGQADELEEEEEGEDEDEEEYQYEDGDEDEEEDEDGCASEFVEMESEEEAEMIDDLEDFIGQDEDRVVARTEPTPPLMERPALLAKRRRAPYVEVEYEEEEGASRPSLRY